MTHLEIVQKNEDIEELDSLRVGDVFRGHRKPGQIRDPQTGRLSPFTFHGELTNVDGSALGERTRSRFIIYDCEIPYTFETSYAFLLDWEDKDVAYRNRLLCLPSLPMLVSNEENIPMNFNSNLRMNKQDILQKIKEIRSSIFQEESEKIHCLYGPELTFF